LAVRPISKLTAGRLTAGAGVWFRTVLPVLAAEFEPGTDLAVPTFGGINGAFSLIFISFSSILPNKAQSLNF
jgi:hypothetical protein